MSDSSDECIVRALACATIERCAKICEDEAGRWGPCHPPDCDDTNCGGNAASNCAERIRELLK